MRWFRIFIVFISLPRSGVEMAVSYNIFLNSALMSGSWKGDRSLAVESRSQAGTAFCVGLAGRARARALGPSIFQITSPC